MMDNQVIDLTSWKYSNIDALDKKIKNEINRNSKSIVSPLSRNFNVLVSPDSDHSAEVSTKPSYSDIFLTPKIDSIELDCINNNTCDYLNFDYDTKPSIVQNKRNDTSPDIDNGSLSPFNIPDISIYNYAQNENEPNKLHRNGTEGNSSSHCDLELYNDSKLISVNIDPAALFNSEIKVKNNEEQIFLKNKNEELTKALLAEKDENEDLRRRIENLEKSIHGLEINIDYVSNRLLSKDNELEEIRKENTLLNNERTDISTNMNKVDEAFQILKKENSTLHEQIRKNNQQNSALSAELEKIHQDKESMEAEKIALLDRVNETQKKIEKEIKMKTEYKNLYESLQNNRSNLIIDRLNQEKARLENENNQIKTSFKSLVLSTNEAKNKSAPNKYPSSSLPEKIDRLNQQYQHTSIKDLLSPHNDDGNNDKSVLDSAYDYISHPINKKVDKEREKKNRQRFTSTEKTLAVNRSHDSFNPTQLSVASSLKDEKRINRLVYKSKLNKESKEHNIENDISFYRPYNSNNNKEEYEKGYLRETTKISAPTRSHPVKESLSLSVNNNYVSDGSRDDLTLYVDSIMLDDCTDYLPHSRNSENYSNKGYRPSIVTNIDNSSHACPYATDLNSYNNNEKQKELLEKELLIFHVEKEQLESEHAKMEQTGIRTIQGRSRKKEIENRLDILNRQISRLKVKLKK